MKLEQVISSEKAREPIAFKRLRSWILKKISPTPRDVILEKAFARELSEKLEKAIGKEARVHFVGSTARDTGLAGDKDVDLFVSFPRDKTRDYIVKKTITATKKTIKANWVMHYAEHPYLQAVIRGFRVEVIPCFQTNPHEPIKSAVDRSPLHMTYLQKRLTGEQKKDVRLLKQFLKNAGIYGAELRIKGFSGLLCEYLILNYRSFWNLVTSASKWRPPVAIDLEGYYPPSEAIKKFSNQPLVFIDAIDRNRNVAAAVSETNLYKFISLCQTLYANPGEESLFLTKPLDVKQIRADLTRLRKESVVERLQEKLGGKLPTTIQTAAWRAMKIILLKFSKPSVVEDVLYPQLEKTTAAIRKHLELNDFRVFATTSFTDDSNAYILLVLPTLERSALVRVSGPPANDAIAVKKFLAKHANAVRGPYIEGSKVYVEELRENNNAEEFLKREIENPESLGIASHLKNPIRKAVLLKDDEVFNSNLSDQAARELHSFFFKKDLR